MSKFRVNINPHNNLEALARYQVSVVKSKLTGEDPKGLHYDCMSAIIAMAFSVEAILNFVGSKKVPNWKERSPFKTKISLLESACGFKFDSSADPYLTLELLKKARDAMAHGQPIVFSVSVGSDKEVARHMRPIWVQATEPAVVIAAYDQIEAFKRFVFSHARIKLGASLTSAVAP